MLVHNTEGDAFIEIADPDNGVAVRVHLSDLNRREVAEFLADQETDDTPGKW